MAWLKRNVGLVITGLIALGLLGFAGYYLYMKKGEADEATVKLNQATEELNRLVNRPVGVSAENIAAAKEDQQKAEKFAQEIKRLFVPPPFPQNLNNRDFGILLDSTLSELRQTAEHSDTKLPLKDYKFSFASQASAPNIAPASLEPLSVQLLEVSAICKVLFSAKVNALDGVKRAVVTSDETAGATDFLTKKPETNDWTIVNPYEVTFKGFSGDLAKVLQGFAKSTNFIIVKNVVVQRADAPVETPTTTADTTSAQPGAADPYSRYGGMMRMMGRGRPGMSPEMARRYGLNLGGAEAQPAQAQTKKNPNVVRDEQLLRVVLSLESVRLKAEPKSASTAASKPARGNPAAAGTEPATK